MYIRKVANAQQNRAMNCSRIKVVFIFARYLRLGSNQAFRACQFYR